MREEERLALRKTVSTRITRFSADHIKTSLSPHERTVKDNSSAL